MTAEVIWDQRIEFLSEPNMRDVTLIGTIGLRGLEGHDEVEVFRVTLPKTWLGVLADTIQHFRVTVGDMRYLYIALILLASLLFAFAAEPGATIDGTQRADTLAGTSNDDLIRAFDGDDTIRGRGGADVIRAGRGNDEIMPGVGDDTIRCGAGNDVLVITGSVRDGDDHWFNCESVIA